MDGIMWSYVCIVQACLEVAHEMFLLWHVELDCIDYAYVYDDICNDHYLWSLSTMLWSMSYYMSLMLMTCVSPLFSKWWFNLAKCMHFTKMSLLACFQGFISGYLSAFFTNPYFLAFSTSVRFGDVNFHPHG